MPVIRPKVVVIGDAMTDVHYKLKYKGLSPEAPCAVYLEVPGGVAQVSGGAANVRLNLMVLGCEVEPVYPENRPVKVRFWNGDVQVMRLDINDESEPVDLTKANFAGAEALVISDYGKGGVTPWVIQGLADLPYGHRRPRVYVDTKQNPAIFSPLGPAALFFPNYKEYSEYPDEYEEVNYILKLGEAGLQDKNGNRFASRTPPEAVVDVCGAGDTVLAAYVYAELIGLGDPLGWANAAAAVTVCKRGAYAPSQGEVNGTYLGA